MDQQELLKLIDQAAREGRSELDLSNKGLTEVPPEIGRLTALKRLNLDYKPNEPGEINQLTALPPKIGQLTGLQFVGLRGNKLKALPPEIGQLTQLQSLDLAHNQLTALPLLHRRRCRCSDCSPKQTCVVVFCLCKCHH